MGKVDFEEGPASPASSPRADLKEPSMLYKVLKTISIVIVWMAIVSITESPVLENWKHESQTALLCCVSTAL